MRRTLLRMVPAATLLLLGPALWNGYPLVYADTGTYLTSGFEAAIPADRPIAYGLFCRLFSGNGTGLWGVVVAQALLTATVLAHAWHQFVARRWALFLVVLALLSATTGLGWYTGRLLPDAFTPMAIVSTGLLLLTRMSAPWRMGHAALLAVACTMHLAHLVLVPVTALIAMLLRCLLREGRPGITGPALVAAAVTSSVFLLALGGRIADHGWSLSRGASLVLLGRIVDAGALPAALERHCLHQGWALCDPPPPRDSRALLWGPDGAVVRAGGWDAYRPEAQAVTRVLLRDAAVRAALWRAAWRDGTAQLVRGGLDELAEPWYRKPISPPYRAIAQFLPHELPAYRRARQHGAGTLDLRTVNAVHHAVIGIALLLLAALLARPCRDRSRVLLLYTAMAVAFAASSCAVLSIPDQRFLSRVSGLLPMAVAMACAARSPHRT